MTTTSIEALNKHEDSGRVALHRKAVLRLVTNHPGSTAVQLHDNQWDLIDEYQLERHEISRRLPELRKSGLVHNGEPMVCTVSGSKQMTWLPGPAPTKQGELF